MGANMTHYLNHSRGMRQFKKLIGNANHLIITVLVGLDSIEKGAVRAAPEELRTAWSPKDPVMSAQRARRMVLDMSLVRAVDALDSYLVSANRKPCLFSSAETREGLNACGTSAYRKFKFVDKQYGISQTCEAAAALVETSIKCRNRAAHTNADEPFPETLTKTLYQNREKISEGYGGLDVEALLRRYDQNKEPTFKEIAAFIRSTNQYVYQLEPTLLQSIDVSLFLQELIWDWASKEPKTDETPEHCRRRRIQGVWGKDADRRMNGLKHILQRSGLSEYRSVNTPAAVSIEDHHINLLTNMKPAELYEWAATDTV